MSIAMLFLLALNTCVLAFISIRLGVLEDQVTEIWYFLRPANLAGQPKLNQR